MLNGLIFKSFILLVSLPLFGACALWDEGSSKQAESTGLIATPPTYYSTGKARYLGVRYKDNLDRLVERITRNPRTAMLQFANNISSVGGIGFFTHSATQSPDERYLEAVLSAPETFEAKGEFSNKVEQLFSRYGAELLEILSGDSDIYQDREMSGYGLNFSWRNVVDGPSGKKRVAVERAILYFPKERVRNFLRQELDQSSLLSNAVIFAVEEDGPLKLASYRPPEPKPDVRPIIQEDNLASSTTGRGLDRAPGAATKPAKSSKLGASDEVAKERKSSESRPAEKLPSPSVKAADAATSEGLVHETPSPAKTGSKSEMQVTAVPATPPALTKGEKSPAVELAALKKPMGQAVPDPGAGVGTTSKQLEGFIIQLAFADKEKAQHWAESMEKRGYAVSVTQAGGEESIRVRLGNFAGRDEADRQLKTFGQEGLRGIVIRLPQAFRPTARTSVP
jgi:cell division septation protein DedD